MRVSLLLWNLLVGCMMASGEEMSVDRVDTDVYIQTTSGRIQGKQYQSRKGIVNVFQGIPYATPPVGQLRFKPSQPLLNPNGDESNREIKFESVVPACMQPSHLTQFSHPSLPQGGKHVSEDCLKLNLYIPSDVKNGEKLPIVLWIPGDGFEFADGSQYDGSTISSFGRIIVAVANYRVGIFGFLGNGTSMVPGNAALHDIVNSLKWIAYNAESFNGSPDQITLAGRFSGAMAISALVSSPMFVRDGDDTKPLASQIILHGGVSGGHYTVEKSPQNSFANFIGKMNCNDEENDKIVTCLLKLSGEDILEKSHRLGQSWRPTIDNAIILEDPLKRVEMGQFPKNLRVMVGHNSGSGSLCYMTHSYMKTDFVEKFEKDNLSNSDFLNLLQTNIKDYFNEEDTSLTSIAAHEYIYALSSDKSLRDTYFRFCSTLYISNPSELYARYFSRFNIPVYRYEFSYRPNSSQNPKWFEGAIGDEVIYLFPPVGVKLNKQEEEVMNGFLSSWTTFIQTGEVTVAGKKLDLFDEDSKIMMRINEDGRIKQTTSAYLDKEVNFWRSVFPPVLQMLQRELQCEMSKSEVRKDVLQSYDMTAHYLAVFLIIVGLCLAVTLTIYFIRNWSKPYLWKFT